MVAFAVAEAVSCAIAVVPNPVSGILGAEYLKQKYFVATLLSINSVIILIIGRKRRQMLFCTKLTEGGILASCNRHGDITDNQIWVVLQCQLYTSFAIRRC